MLKLLMFFVLSMVTQSCVKQLYNYVTIQTYGDPMN